MYAVVNRLEVNEGPEAFEQLFSDSMRDHLGGVPGLRRATLLQPMTGSTYLSVMEFDDEEAFRSWMRSDAFRAAHDGSSGPGNQAMPSTVETYNCILDVAP